MAFIEQLVYALPGPGGQDAAILARSSGITREVAGEIAGLCSRWSPPLSVDTPHTLLSAPLRAYLPGTKGHLHVAVRAASEGQGRTMAHALIIGQDDYAAFGFNPFRLEREGLFLDRWAPGLILERVERRPTSLAALVTPLPDARDADLIDEALRLYFASARMVLPLECPDEASDRFLALFLESLPHYMRRQLCFASFAAGGQDTFTAGAVAMADGSFQTWRRSLMATVRKPLPPELEGYVAAVRRLLTAGDLMGLDAVSRSLDSLQPSVRHTSGGEFQPEHVAATITTMAEPAPDQHVWQRSRIAGPDRAAIVPVTASAGGPTPRPAGGAPRSRPGGAAGGRVWLVMLGVAAVVVVVVLLVGRRTVERGIDTAGRGVVQAATDAVRSQSAAAVRAPSVPPSRQAEPAPSAESKAGGLGGVLDIGALYASELEVFNQAVVRDPSEGGRRAAADRALAALRERGAEDLRRQAGGFCAAATGDLAWPLQPAREAEATRRREPAGATLTCEVGRCLLAAYGLEHGAPWGDLGKLDESRLTARCDSVRRRDAAGLTAAAEGLKMAGLFERLAEARRSQAGRGRLARLLAQPRRDAGWLDDLDAAAADLSAGTLPPALAAWRAAALDLARLKRAEDGAGFGGLAMAADYAAGRWFPEAVRDALAALQATVSAQDAATPPLVCATLDAHAALAQARQLAGGDPQPGELERLFGALSGNAGVAFDPDAYADHLDRTRMLALATLLARGRTPDAVPTTVFPREDRRAALTFLTLERDGADPQKWRDYAAATAVPFLSRWATARAGQPAAERLREPDRFDADFQRLALAAAELAAQAQRGQDWSATLASLRTAMADFAARNPVQPSTSDDRRERLGRLAALGATLERPLAIPLERIEVHLAPDQMSAPAEVAVELLAGAGESLLRTPALLAEADPAGGWRVQRDLAAEIALRPGQPLRAVVSRIADGRILFTARYEGSAAAPGALLRPVAGVGSDGGRPGSLAFGAPGWFWRKLRVPDLRQPLAATAGM